MSREVFSCVFCGRETACYAVSVHPKRVIVYIMPLLAGVNRTCRTASGGVCMSLLSREGLLGDCGEDIVCGARFHSMECIAAARLENTSSSTDGFQRHPQTISSPPPQRQTFAGTKDSARGIPKPRPLRLSHALSEGQPVAATPLGERAAARFPSH